MRVLFALAGFHRVNRGAEVALESVAAELARRPGWLVTLIGSGEARGDAGYRFVRARCSPRERFERWPSLPVFRNEYVYEEATFAPRLWREYRPDEFDLTATCAYPFTNWVLRGKRGKGTRPRHVFVTQNGDWPLRTRRREYRFFGCDGVVCINPEHEANARGRFPCSLIPNGVDVQRFSPARDEDERRSLRQEFGLPEGPLALVAAALIPSKRVLEAIEAVSRVPGLGLVVAGDGPLRERVASEGRARLGDRFVARTFPRERMPDVYRCADVLVHMSLDEPFGNIYIEAMASGLASVAHRTITTEWIFSPAPGEPTLADLTDARDLDAVARAIERTLADRSPSRASALRRACSARFAWPAVAAKYGAFFEEVAAGAPRSAEASGRQGETGEAA